ncbi:uncharacterized protein LOC142981430 [Anticarsia gemmatalis]|uniref:uncharacterized protein LOC142981430 n=1 Tax=Anticarsia gemmatalis TaxID=129554 RepID=UPI003F75A229
MAPKELEGSSLREKHRHYNKLLKDSINANQPLTDINYEDSDLENLLKIDLACRAKDVQYILNVLKSDDMLYVSKAIARSTWMITDQQYAGIINPQYLQSELFPNMTIKAINKFKRHIRLNIKDETRAESFYLNEKSDIDAAKWLPYCSVDFIGKNVVDHFKSHNKSIDTALFKRLCEKSVSIFEIILKGIEYYEREKYLQVVTFLLNTDIDKYLDALDNNDEYYGYPKLNRKATKLIMNHSPKRVFDQIEKYIQIIHIPTFVRYLKVDEIKGFLYAQAKKNLNHREFRNLTVLFQLNTLKHFINKLPKDEQFDFVKKLCMRKENEDLEREKETLGMEAHQIKSTCCKYNREPYLWYQFAPFQEAYDEITKLISLSSIPCAKREMLSFLITCAEQNLQHIQMLLKYYIHQCKDEETFPKLKFVSKLLEHTHISKYDKTTWDLFNQVLSNSNSKSNSTCSDLRSNCKEVMDSILIYKALNDPDPPEDTAKLFESPSSLSDVFNTFVTHKNEMNEDQQSKVFNYLYENLLLRLKNPINNEEDFSQAIKVLEYILKLLHYWDKDFLDFPVLLEKIREFIQLKKKNSWKESLSCLYDVNKSWRKHMFNESVALNPCEEVCLNVLKHNSQLLERYTDEVTALRTNDKLSLRRFLIKLRIYWPQSLVQQWIDTYLNHINGTITSGQKAAVKAVCTVLPKKLLLDIIEKYKPESAKIDWKTVDERVLIIQQLIAKNMHLGRPQPIPDAILSYAKGDYLQFALPSLLAIFHNLKFTMNQQYIPKLLDSPVSVQKHGIRFAFRKLEREELKKIFLNCWKTSKNATIRSLIFNYTFKLLCNESDTTKVISLWELLESFIENLTFTDDKSIYEKLSEVEKVPLSVRAKFLVKSYNFLKQLIPTVDESNRSNYEWQCNRLAEHSREVMETMDLDFVTSLIQEFYEDFFNDGEKSNHLSVAAIISAYLLCAHDETEQLQKYEKIFVPLMRRSVEKWAEKRDGHLFVKSHVKTILSQLLRDIEEYVIPKNMIVPSKMYSLIQVELEKSLSIPENYNLLTTWKLAVSFTKLVQGYSSEGKEWDAQLGQEFGHICLEVLKRDVTLHFPCIYVLFAKSVKEIINHRLSTEVVQGFYDSMLSDKDFIHGYLCSIDIGQDGFKGKVYDQIWENVISHPSVEIKMHYYSKIDIQAIN